MAKSKQPKVRQVEVVEQVEEKAPENVPFGAGAGREPHVGEPKKTFAERTGGVNKPWLDKDGNQVNE